MEYILNNLKPVFESKNDIGTAVYAGQGLTVECFNLKKSTSVLVTHDQPEYFEGEKRTICYIVLSGTIEVWLGKDKAKVQAGGTLTVCPDDTYSIWALEDTVFLASHNKVEPDVDNTPAQLVDAVARVERKDSYLQGHNYRVGKYSTLIMQILESGRSTTTFHMAAAYHDVGKVVIPDQVLNKVGRLTEEEFAEIKKHPAASYEMLKEYLGESVANFARWHHEKMDGTGYPDGLKGDEIPLESRVMAVADIFDALTTARCYRDAFSFEKALDIMKGDAEAGKIDGAVLKVLINLVAEGKIVDGVDNYVTVRPGK